jgi:proteasome lid subunit RPN8/RPN11
MDVASANAAGDGSGDWPGDARLDARDIDLAPLETREPPVPLAPQVHAYAVGLSASVWKAMQAHACSVTEMEVGGVMLGKVYRDLTGRPWLWIDAVVPALAAESRSSNVTFTADAWSRIHEIIDRDHPGAMIVGWYHTHPGFGIFLSDMDVFIQRHFFNLPHQIAIVIDPVAHTHGCFVWRDDVPTNEPYWIEGQPAPAPASTPAPKSTPTSAPESAPKSAATPDRQHGTPATRPSSSSASSSSASGSMAFVPGGLSTLGAFAARVARARWSFGRAIDFLSRLNVSQWAALATLMLVTCMLITLLVLVTFNGGN